MIPHRTLAALTLVVACSTVALHADDAPPASQPSPVDYHKLKDAMPDSIIGLKRTKNAGSRMAFGPTSMTNVKADYGDEDGKPNVHIEAVSYGNADMIKQMSMAFTMTQIDSEDDDGFQKTMKIQDHPGMVEYKSKDKHGSITVGAGDRILITVTLENVTADQLKAVEDALPLKALDEAAK